MARRRVVVGLSAAVMAMSAAVVPAAAASHSARTAAAGGPGVWVQLSSGSGISTIDDPGVARFDDNNLHVVWTQDTNNSMTRLNTRVIAKGGAPASATNTVLTWKSLDEFPSIMQYGGNALVAFGGLQDTDSSNPYSAGYGYYATSPDGATWTVADGTFGTSKANYGAYGADSVNAGGTPFMVSNPGTTNDTAFHAGLDELPPLTDDGSTTPISNCCAYDAGVGWDQTNSAAWAAWYTNTGKPATDGINAQRVYPTLGTLTHAPLATNKSLGSYSSLPQDQRVAVAARSGGGLYVAYRVGYPTAHKIAFWKLGTANPMLISTSDDVEYPNAAPGPDGRMWVYWYGYNSGILHAARTNENATRLGAVCSVTTPNHTTSVWKTAGDGSNGPLDLVVNAGDGNKEQISSTQIRPCLTVHVNPVNVASKKGGSVTVTVLDAGDPVQGASVGYQGTRKSTNKDGEVSFNVAKGTAKGRHTISYSAAGYTPGSTGFRVH